MDVNDSLPTDCIYAATPVGEIVAAAALHSLTLEKLATEQREGVAVRVTLRAVAEHGEDELL